MDNNVIEIEKLSGPPSSFDELEVAHSEVDALGVEKEGERGDEEEAAGHRGVVDESFRPQTCGISG